MRCVCGLGSSLGAPPFHVISPYMEWHLALALWGPVWEQRADLQPARNSRHLKSDLLKKKKTVEKGRNGGRSLVQ